MRPVIEKLQHSFDHEKLLAEYQTLFNEVGSIAPNPMSMHQSTIFFKEQLLPDAKRLCPYLTEVCDQLASEGLKFNYGCFRLLFPRSTLEWHVDEYVAANYHIPIKANEGCFYACDNRLFNMQNLGWLYKVDSSRPHTFINCGNDVRIHAHFVTDTSGHLLREEYA